MEDTVKLILEYSSVFGALATIVTFCTLVLSVFIKPLGRLIGRLWTRMVKRAVDYNGIMDNVERTAKSVERLLTMVEENIQEDREFRVDVSHKLNLHSEALMETLGNTIRRIYENHKAVRCITVAEKTIMERMFAIYTALGGNHEIKIMHKEMQSWNVD